MAREARRNLPNFKYHNERGRLGLSDNTTALQEAFETLEEAGSLHTDEEKVPHLIDSISKEILSTGTLSHIFSNPELSGEYQAVATNAVTTDGYLKLIGYPPMIRVGVGAGGK